MITDTISYPFRLKYHSSHHLISFNIPVSFSGGAEGGCYSEILELLYGKVGNFDDGDASFFMSSNPVSYSQPWYPISLKKVTASFQRTDMEVSKA